MALSKLQQQVQDLANNIDENYIDIDEVDKDESENDCETDCDSETTLEDDYISGPESVEEQDPTPPPSPVKKVKRKYTKREPKVGIATSDPNIQVIMKSKKKGPNKVKQVVVYREDVPQQEIQIVEKTRRARGRPKSKQLGNVIKEAEEPVVIAFENDG